MELGEAAPPLTLERPRTGLRHRRSVAAALEIARNLSRRRLRSGLTIGGITIGVLALTTLGSMAELADSQLASGQRFLSDHILVQAANQAGSSLITGDEVTTIRSLSGVAAAYPTWTMPADAEPPILGSTGNIVANDVGEYGRLADKLPVARGRGLRQGDASVTVVGIDFAARKHLDLGSRLTLPVAPSDGSAVSVVGRQFTVVGIMSRTLAGPDQWAEISMADASALVASTLPAGLPADSVGDGIDVYGRAGANLDALARQIQTTIRGLQAIPPSQTERVLQSVGAVYTALTTGSALIALLVGGLSVVNTMLMAVTDRVREIGIKRAIGAPTGRIVLELLVESAVLGAIGGLIGLVAGWALTSALNGLTETAQNIDLFLLTPRLAIAVPLFAIGLGLAAGLPPAIRAARLDPAVALRAQD